MPNLTRTFRVDKRKIIRAKAAKKGGKIFNIQRQSVVVLASITLSTDDASGCTSIDNKKNIENKIELEVYS